MNEYSLIQADANGVKKKPSGKHAENSLLKNIYIHYNKIKSNNFRLFGMKGFFITWVSVFNN